MSRKPDADDERHLREAHESSSGFVHPMTAMRFEALGWLRRTNGRGFLVPGEYELTPAGRAVLAAPGGTE